MSVEHEVKAANKFLNLYQQCKRDKKEFNLTLMGVSNILSSKKCFYTGKPFTPHDPLSFDRVDSTKGYVTGNVVACRHTVNQAKANLSEEDIIAMAEAIKKRKKNEV